MNVIFDPMGTRYRIDPESSIFFVKNGNDPVIILARNEATATYVVGEALGRRESATRECREIVSFNYWPDSKISKGRQAKNTRTIMVAPRNDTTDVFVLNEIPDEVFTMLSSAVPGPETRGIWPHRLTVRERRNFLLGESPAL